MISAPKPHHQYTDVYKPDKESQSEAGGNGCFFSLILLLQAHYNLGLLLRAQIGNLLTTALTAVAAPSVFQHAENKHVSCF